MPETRKWTGSEKANYGKETSDMLDLLSARASKTVLKRVIRDANAGVTRAQEIILARVWPERKGRLLEIPALARDVANASEIRLMMRDVVRCVATGRITPEEGETLARLLDAERRMIESSDLEARIRRLEAGG